MYVYIYMYIYVYIYIYIIYLQASSYQSQHLPGGADATSSSQRFSAQSDDQGAGQAGQGELSSLSSSAEWR